MLDSLGMTAWMLRYSSARRAAATAESTITSIKKTRRMRRPCAMRGKFGCLAARHGVATQPLRDLYKIESGRSRPGTCVPCINLADREHRALGRRVDNHHSSGSCVAPPSTAHGIEYIAEPFADQANGPGAGPASAMPTEAGRLLTQAAACHGVKAVMATLAMNFCIEDDATGLPPPARHRPA